MSIAFALALSPAFALQSLTIVDGPKPDANGMAVDYGNGVCRVSLFGKDGDGEQIRAEFSRRLRDGNMGVSLYGPFIRKFRQADPDANYPVTVAIALGRIRCRRVRGICLGRLGSGCGIGCHLRRVEGGELVLRRNGWEQLRPLHLDRYGRGVDRAGRLRDR